MPFLSSANATNIIIFMNMSEGGTGVCMALCRTGDHRILSTTYRDRSSRGREICTSVETHLSSALHLSMTRPHPGHRSGRCGLCCDSIVIGGGRRTAMPRAPVAPTVSARHPSGDLKQCIPGVRSLPANYFYTYAVTVLYLHYCTWWWFAVFGNGDGRKAVKRGGERFSLFLNIRTDSVYIPMKKITWKTAGIEVSHARKYCFAPVDGMLYIL